MTTTLSTPTPTPAPTLPRPVAGRREWRLGFGGILRAEITKLFSVRSSYWMLAVMAAGYAGLSAVYFATFPVSEYGKGAITPDVYVAGALFAQLIIVVLGALVITGEYSTGSIRSTFAAVPRRTPVLLAKALVTMGVTAVATAVSIGIAILVSLPLWGRTGAVTFTPEFARQAALSVFYLACLSLIALGLGAVIRATPGAITAGLGLILVVPTVLSGFLGNLGWTRTIAKFLPDAQFNHMMMWKGGQGILTGWQAMAVLGAWVVVALTAGYLRLTRSDV